MLRRSLTSCRNAAVRLADLPETLPDPTPLERGSVVLRIRLNARETPASQYRAQRQTLKNTVDVFSHHKQHLQEYERLRAVPGAFLCHPPLTLQTNAGRRWATLLLPTHQLATAMGYTGQIGGTKTTQLGLTDMAVKAACVSLFNEAQQVTRTGGVITSPAADRELLLHPRFNDVDTVLEFLRTRGVYLPCVTHADDLFVGQEVPRAFADGHVSVDTTLGGTLQHAKHLRWLLESGFGLHLPGVRAEQLSTFRLKHGGEECVILGQRLALYYDSISTDRATGVVYANVGRVDVLSAPHAAHTERAMATRLLLKEQDFEQTATRPGQHHLSASATLLRRVPSESREMVRQAFDTHLNTLNTWHTSSAQRRGRASRELIAEVSKTVATVQRLVPTVDFGGKIAAAVESIAPAFDRAAEHRASVRGPRELDDATAQYLQCLETVLQEELVKARDAALEYYDVLLAGGGTDRAEESGGNGDDSAMWPKEVLADAVTESTPFYANLHS